MQLGYAQDAEIIDLGNGSEDADWASASGAVGMVWGKEEYPVTLNFS